MKTGRIVETREAVGTVRAFESIIVTAKVSGIVQKISFEEGQKVKAGDILVELDAEERRADIEQAVAEIRRAERAAERAAHRASTARMALRRTGAGTEAQVEDLTAQMQDARERHRGRGSAAQGAPRRAWRTSSSARPSTDGSARGRSRSERMSRRERGSPPSTISRACASTLRCRRTCSRLKLGQTGARRSAAFGERAFEGKVTVIDPRVDPVTRTVRLTAEFPTRTRP